MCIAPPADVYHPLRAMVFRSECTVTVLCRITTTTTTIVAVVSFRFVSFEGISNEVTDLVVIHEHRGEPDTLMISHLPHGPTASFSLSNVVMRHDIPDAGTVSEAYPHLIFNNFKTTLGERTMSILKYLFPVPKEESKRVLTFSNDSDYISFRHHVYTRSGKDVELAEVGPRWEMKLYKIMLGTIDHTDADTEWVHRPYMNTAKKKRNL